MRARPAKRLRRARRSDAADLASWCDALARALRGGTTLHHALRTVAPPQGAAESLAPALLALERGLPVGRAVADVRGASSDLDLVLVVLRACADNGGAAAEPIDRAAAALRQRAALAGERRTHSAQARMSALVMTLLPGAMLFMLAASSASVRAVVLTPVGLVVIAAGAVLNVAGWSWMRRLIGSAAR
jgi:tight adherence protein B